MVRPAHTAQTQNRYEAARRDDKAHRPGRSIRDSPHQSGSVQFWRLVRVAPASAIRQFGVVPGASRNRESPPRARIPGNYREQAQGAESGG